MVFVLKCKDDVVERHKNNVNNTKATTKANKNDFNLHSVARQERLKIFFKKTIVGLSGFSRQSKADADFHLNDVIMNVPKFDQSLWKVLLIC